MRWVGRIRVVGHPAGRSGRGGVPGVSVGQGADLDQVVGEDSVSGPGPGTFGGVDHGSIPSVAAFEVADPSFAASTPFQVSSERSLSFVGLSGFAESATAGNHDLLDAEVVQGVVDGLFAVTAVGGHRLRCPPGAFLERSTAGLSRGASAGLPGWTSWSSTIPSSLSQTWAL